MYKGRKLRITLLPEFRLRELGGMVDDQSQSAVLEGIPA
jgi:hypothetical protein